MSVLALCSEVIMQWNVSCLNIYHNRIALGSRLLAGRQVCNLLHLVCILVGYKKSGSGYSNIVHMGSGGLSASVSIIQYNSKAVTQLTDWVRNTVTSPIYITTNK